VLKCGCWLARKSLAGREVAMRGGEGSRVLGKLCSLYAASVCHNESADMPRPRLLSVLATAAVEGWVVLVTGVHEEAQEEDVHDTFAGKLLPTLVLWQMCSCGAGAPTAHCMCCAALPTACRRTQTAAFHALRPTTCRVWRCEEYLHEPRPPHRLCQGLCVG
jgi:hypothetical protein